MPLQVGFGLTNLTTALGRVPASRNTLYFRGSFDLLGPPSAYSTISLQLVQKDGARMLRSVAIIVAISSKHVCMWLPPPPPAPPRLPMQGRWCT